MSSSKNILLYGDNTNLDFYAWRLSSAGHLITQVKSQPPSSGPSIWISKKFNESQKPSIHTPSLATLTSVATIPDVIVLSSTNLSSFSTICEDISSFTSKNPNVLILIESTGFLQLETYVQQAVALPSDHIFSIMNDSDIKKIPNSNSSNNIFVHQIKNNNDYIYIGNSVKGNSASNDYTPDQVSNLNFLNSIFVNSGISSFQFKTQSYLEFLNYQWKFILPRVVLDPLLVFFEISFPDLLANEILAKPLITGILKELLMVLKKMNCKFIKGYENENSLLNTWIKYYNHKHSIEYESNQLKSLLSSSTNNQLSAILKYLSTSNFFFDFYFQNYHQFNYDILLLPPILLADDHQLKSAYLEFLYSSICRFDFLNNNNTNSKKKSSSSVFFTRLTPELLQKLKNYTVLQDKVTELSNSKRILEEKNNSLIKSMNDLTVQVDTQRKQIAEINMKFKQQQQGPVGVSQSSSNRRSASDFNFVNGIPNTPGRTSSNYNGHSPARKSIIDESYDASNNTADNRKSLNNNNANRIQAPPPPPVSLQQQQMNTPLRPGIMMKNSSSSANFQQQQPQLQQQQYMSQPPNGMLSYNKRVSSFSSLQQQQPQFTGSSTPYQQQQPAVPQFTGSSTPMQQPQQVSATNQQSVPHNSFIPSLESQAAFVDKSPFGKNSVSLNDVTSRFVPQSRKNRKSSSSLVAAAVRAKSNNNLSGMATPVGQQLVAGALSPRNEDQGNSNGDYLMMGNGNTNNIDQYNLYGGDAQLSGKLMNGNRMSSTKLNKMAGNSTPMMNGNGNNGNNGAPMMNGMRTPSIMNSTSTQNLNNNTNNYNNGGFNYNYNNNSNNGRPASNNTNTTTPTTSTTTTSNNTANTPTTAAVEGDSTVGDTSKVSYSNNSLSEPNHAPAISMSLNDADGTMSTMTDIDENEKLKKNGSLKKKKNRVKSFFGKKG